MPTAAEPGGASARPDAPSKSTRQLLRVLEHHRIDRVIDVGANTGQYARRLRRAGYRGAVVSVEPASAAYAELVRAAAGDPGWSVAPRLALGAEERTVTLRLSGEPDMSSVLAMTPAMARLLDSAAPVGQEEVRQARLDALLDDVAAVDARLLLKVDTQGTELSVIEGARGVLDRLRLIQLELSILPVYKGEPDYRTVIDALAGLGFAPVLFIPGYFNRRTARLISMDGVFAPVDPASP